MSTVIDFLFYILNGVPILYTFWIAPWIVFFVIVMMWPLILPTPRSWGTMWITPVFIVAFFGGMVMAVAPPLAQLQVMSECRSFETQVSSELSESKTITLRECRRRSTVYEELGSWSIQQGSK
jgi:hypothetical protein